MGFGKNVGFTQGHKPPNLEGYSIVPFLVIWGMVSGIGFTTLLHFFHGLWVPVLSFSLDRSPGGWVHSCCGCGHHVLGGWLALGGQAGWLATSHGKLTICRFSLPGCQEAADFPTTRGHLLQWLLVEYGNFLTIGDPTIGFHIKNGKRWVILGSTIERTLDLETIAGLRLLDLSGFQARRTHRPEVRHRRHWEMLPWFLGTLVSLENHCVYIYICIYIYVYIYVYIYMYIYICIFIYNNNSI